MAKNEYEITIPFRVMADTDNGAKCMLAFVLGMVSHDITDLEKSIIGIEVNQIQAILIKKGEK